MLAVGIYLTSDFEEYLDMKKTLCDLSNKSINSMLYYSCGLCSALCEFTYN